MHFRYNEMNQKTNHSPLFPAIFHLNWATQQYVYVINGTPISGDRLTGTPLNWEYHLWFSSLIFLVFFFADCKLTQFLLLTHAWSSKEPSNLYISATFKIIGIFRSEGSVSIWFCFFPIKYIVVCAVAVVPSLYISSSWSIDHMNK